MSELINEYVVDIIEREKFKKYSEINQKKVITFGENLRKFKNKFG